MFTNVMRDTISDKRDSFLIEIRRKDWNDKLTKKRLQCINKNTASGPGCTKLGVCPFLVLKMIRLTLKSPEKISTTKSTHLYKWTRTM